MSGVMSVFDKYSSPDKDAELILADYKEWISFKIYVFTQKKMIDLENDLKTLNDLSPKHEGDDYEEFSVCLEHLLLPGISFGFISRKKNRGKNVFQFFGKLLDHS